MKTKFFLLLSVVALSFSTVSANAIITKKTVHSTLKTQDYCGVSSDQIIQYMLSHGITITAIAPIAGSCDVMAKSIDRKNYIIYISNGIITGYDETNG